MGMLGGGVSAGDTGSAAPATAKGGVGFTSGIAAMISATRAWMVASMSGVGGGTGVAVGLGAAKPAAPMTGVDGISGAAAGKKRARPTKTTSTARVAARAMPMKLCLENTL